MKCSVPLGRFMIAARLMISVHTDCLFGYFSESSLRYLRS